MLICFHAPSPLVYFGLFRINTMAHTLGMSIQQHQQKSLLKFYVLPRAKTSRFPEKSSEKRLKTPWVKVQVHRICLTRQLASFCHASKNGRKKARKSFYFPLQGHKLSPPARERNCPLPHFFLLPYAGNGMISLSGGSSFGCFSSGCMALSNVPMSR